MRGVGSGGVKTDHSVSVIICAYSNERQPQLNAAITSVMMQASKPDEIIVVIDHNVDLQKQVEAQFPNIKTIANGLARGLSGARNSGVQCAAGNIVGFIDDDAVADKLWLTHLLEHYKDPSVMGVGGAVVPKWARDKPRWFPEEFNWVVGCSYIGQPLETMLVRNPIGCNMSFRRELFDCIGGFREGIGREGSNASGCEETEFCIRAYQAHPQSCVLYDPQAIVHHQVTAERSQWSYFRKRCIAEGRSKRQVVNRTGARDGLSSERKYATRTLPMGVLRGIGESITKLDPWGLARSWGILAGLSYTAYGYFDARWRKSWGQTISGETIFPIKILDLEIQVPYPEIEACDRTTGQTYAGVFCLLRQSGKPIGILETALHGKNLDSAELANLIHEKFGEPNQSPTTNRGTATTRQFVNVIVATRDRIGSLVKCLDSLLNQNYSAFDVIVVDNAPSSTRTETLIASHYASTGRVHYLREDRPGLGRAHNSGLAIATAEIVAFTDDDVIVDPNWLSAIVNNFETGENIACVTGLILPAELDTRAQVWTEKHGGFGKGFKRTVFDIKKSQQHGPLFPFTAGQFGSGANMAFRRKALQHVGLFDEALGAGTAARGGDDLAAFHAVVHAGFQLVYEPEAIVWHHHRREEEGMRHQAFSYGMGLGAYLTKLVIDEPNSGIKLAKLFPAGINHMVGHGSAKSQRLPADYPKSLVWRERLGIAAGVIGYLKSRSAARKRPQSRSVGSHSAALMKSED